MKETALGLPIPDDQNDFLQTVSDLLTGKELEVGIYETTAAYIIETMDKPLFTSVVKILQADFPSPIVQPPPLDAVHASMLKIQKVLSS